MFVSTATVSANINSNNVANSDYGSDKNGNEKHSAIS